jgi:predicted site-specific integrase-resolvase
LTTTGDFIIIHFSHEAFGLGSSAGDQLYHRLVVVSGRKVPVQDVLEILTSACGRLDGRRSARNRARRALEAMGCG